MIELTGLNLNEQEKLFDSFLTDHATEKQLHMITALMPKISKLLSMFAMITPAWAERAFYRGLAARCLTYQIKNDRWYGEGFGKLNIHISEVMGSHLQKMGLVSYVKWYDAVRNVMLEAAETEQN